MGRTEQSMIKTIGFFGDSFCAVNETKYPVTTYIQKLASHYDAKVTSLGQHGASIGQLYMKQLKPIIDNNTLPDVCVFTWTDPGRLYVPGRTGVGYMSARQIHTTDLEFWDAANKYFTHLYNHDWAIVQYTAMCQFIDNQLAAFTDSKIIHVWSFGNPVKGDIKTNIDPDDVEYFYRWKTGIEIRPPLSTISCQGDTTDIQTAPNHLNTQNKNDLVFNWIKDAIDNYEYGTLTCHKHNII
jgi:hypothetical protein